MSLHATIAPSKADNRHLSSFVPVAEGTTRSSLDLYSTSQTSAAQDDLCSEKNPEITEEICHNYAPYFALSIADSDKKYWIWQGNCNDWTCPRCGQLRAKKEYGRIVLGCRQLAVDNDLYFMTLTCRGSDMSVEEADEKYGSWTNKLLTACRTRAKRAGESWHYVQVTEKQKRGHPHSHILMTWKPHDLRLGEVEKWRTLQDGSREKYMKEALRSDWLQKRCISAGLGEQYDISKVDTVEGASRYVAKYLFKDTMFSTRWKKDWHRVRYSQSFPKLPPIEGKKKAIALVTQDDWQALAKQAVVIKVAEGHDYIHLSKRLGKSDTVIQLVKVQKQES